MIFSGYIGVVFGGISRHRSLADIWCNFCGFLGVVWADIMHGFE